MSARAAEHLWIAGMLDDVESDLSALHGIRHPMKLDSPRFFRLASRLGFYTGAVQARLHQRYTADGSAPAAGAPGTEQGTELELETVLGMKDSFGHGPADLIEYAGG